MAKRKFIFRDLSGSGLPELALPVTPDSYQVEKGVNVETINIHALGDAIVMGYGTLATISISCLLPRRSYRFSASSNAQTYIQRFEQWVEEKTELRFIISGTNVNIPVRVQSISYGERDGTNDLYADITLREYRNLQAVQVKETTTESKGRAAPETASSSKPYVIKPGDTLSAICYKEYGDASAATYNKVAAINNISNPHLIYAGNTIILPQPLT